MKILQTVVVVFAQAERECLFREDEFPAPLIIAMIENDFLDVVDEFLIGIEIILFVFEVVDMVDLDIGDDRIFRMICRKMPAEFIRQPVFLNLEKTVLVIVVVVVLPWEPQIETVL